MPNPAFRRRLSVIRDGLLCKAELAVPDLPLAMPDVACGGSPVGGEGLAEVRDMP